MCTRVSMASRDDVQRQRRDLNEQLRALSYAPLMRGSIVERRRRCGRARCACVTDPAARHPGTVLVVSLNGKSQSIPLRREDVARVQRAIDGYVEAWRIINALTECELDDLGRERKQRTRKSSSP